MHSSGYQLVFVNTVQLAIFLYVEHEVLLVAYFVAELYVVEESCATGLE